MIRRLESCQYRLHSRKTDPKTGKRKNLGTLATREEAQQHEPDVWGQARLTKHREEFEKEMQGDLGNFKEKLNGSLTRADSAFFSQAVALGIAAQPRRGSSTSTNTNQVAVAPSATPIEIAVPDLRKANTITPSVVLPKAEISLEPTLYVAQKERYLNLLNQIRRTNEGDDTADSAGYSLNLVRIPVSILPGKKTTVGHGAEITFTLSPILSDELLPMTFRNLVVNDLVDQLGFPLVRFLESPEAEAWLKEDIREQIVGEEATVPGNATTNGGSPDNATPMKNDANTVPNSSDTRKGGPGR